MSARSLMDASSRTSAASSGDAAASCLPPASGLLGAGESALRTSRSKRSPARAPFQSASYHAARDAQAKAFALAVAVVCGGQRVLSLCQEAKLPPVTLQESRSKIRAIARNPARRVVDKVGFLRRREKSQQSHSQNARARSLEHTCRDTSCGFGAGGGSSFDPCPLEPV
eukprot:COSAG04_NODE_1861_length_5373_cov_2.087410_4_plen_169_part_00